MSTAAWILIAVAAVLIVIAIVAFTLQRRRSTSLRQRFGPEYDRAVDRSGDRGRAERELESRVKRREQLQIRSLDGGARERYVEEWKRVQAAFVDAPSEAIRKADRLVMSVMRERGYPVDDFEARSADVSVDHPRVVEDYRAAHKISLANRENRASTEDLRQAMVHYRALFTELLGADGQRQGAAAGAERTRPSEPRGNAGQEQDRPAEDARRE
jgi:hypothetical protein